MVVLATRLYGGFEEETCVYDQFQKEFPTDNTQRQHEIQVKNTTQIKEELVWKATFAEAECQIKVKRPNIDEPLEYINVIGFATNWKPSSDPALNFTYVYTIDAKTGEILTMETLSGA